MPKRVFITGANGFLGSHLADACLARGDTVTCLVRKSSDLRWLDGKPVHLVYGDVTDAKTDWQEQLAHQEIVFHSAGVIKAFKANDYHRVNAEGTRRLLKACKTANTGLKRFILISSIAAHGPALNGNLMSEQDEPHPVSDYGKSKVAAEKIVQTEAEKVPWTIIRPAAIYGPRDYQLLPFFQLAAKGVRTLLGVRERRLNFVYVDDVVQCCLLAADNPKAVGAIYNAGGLENPSYRQVGIELLKALGKKRSIPLPLPTVGVYTLSLISTVWARMTGQIPLLPWDKTREFVQRRWTVDIRKAQTELGYQPQTPFSDGVKKTAQWYRQEGSL